MNVLVLSLPGLRLHHLGCYGNEWVATPAIDRFAAEAIVFDHHYADTPGVPPAFRPEWSGLCDHFAANHENDTAYRPMPSLRRTLEASGVGCTFPDDLPRSRVSGDSPWDETFRQVLRKVEAATGGGPWLFWAEGPTLAPPWDLTDKLLAAYNEDDEEAGVWSGPASGPIGTDEEYVRLQLTYAAVVTHVDGVLNDFLDLWKDLPSSADTLLILTCDRGLTLGEHGIIGDYRPWLHDEVVHLPLIMRLPNGAEAGRRVSALTQPVDLYATALETFGLPAGGTQGQSLLPLARGRHQSFREFAYTSLRTGDEVEWSLRSRDWAYLLPVCQSPGDVPRMPQLYAKPEDVWEVNDVRDRNQAIAEQLDRQLRGYMNGVARGGSHEYREIGG